MIFYSACSIAWKRAIIILSSIWCLSFLFNFFKDWNHFSTNNFLLAAIILIILSSICLYQLVLGNSIPKLHSYPWFWFSIAALVFFSTMAVIFSGYLKLKEASVAFSIFREVVNVIHYSLLSLTVLLLTFNKQWQKL